MTAPKQPIDPHLKRQLRRVARKQRRAERARSADGTSLGPLAALRETRRAAILRLGKRSRPIIDGLLRRYQVLDDAGFPDPGHFQWIAELESKTGVIAAELDRVMREVGELPELRAISPDHNRIAQEDWKAFFLYGYGHRSEVGCRLCPETAKAVERIPQLESAFFSILLPGMHIKHHKGPTKSLVVCHLGVKIPQQAEKCVIRVGDEYRPWRQGRVLVIDDTYDHEVWNDTDETRVVLLIHVRRPLRFPGSLVGSAIFNAIRWSPFVKDGRRNLAAWERSVAGIESRPGGA